MKCKNPKCTSGKPARRRDLCDPCYNAVNAEVNRRARTKKGRADLWRKLERQGKVGKPGRPGRKPNSAAEGLFR